MGCQEMQHFNSDSLVTLDSKESVFIEHKHDKREDSKNSLYKMAFLRMNKHYSKLGRKEKCWLLLLPVVTFFFLSANTYNPTLLPEALRFPPTCSSLSPGNSITSGDIGQPPPRYAYPRAIMRDYSHFNDHSWLPRFLGKKSHGKTVALLKSISELFQKHNVTYVLYHGTLLGSYMFHDLIPWDDDLDILVSFDSINRVRAMLRDPDVSMEFGAVSYHDPEDIYSEPFIAHDVDTNNINYCGNHTKVMNKKCKHKFHFYRHDSDTTLKRHIGFPYIDVKFYITNTTHVIPIDQELDPLTYRKDDFYPIHYRPFFNIWQPVPRNTRKLLQMKFSDFKCASKWYSHHTQTIAMGYESRCKFITGCYPYVRRLPACLENRTQSDNSNLGGKGVIEQLILDETVIYEAFIAETYEDVKPFEL